MSVLLIGLGRWGEKHLRVLRELGVGVWVAEVTPTRLAWAVAHGVPAERATADYRSALGAVDAVDIVTPADGFKRPRTDVGVLQTDGIHYVDLFAHLLGREATAATAVQRDFLGRGLAA